MNFKQTILKIGVFNLLFILIGLIAIFRTGHRLYKINDSKSWTPVEAQLKNVERKWTNNHPRQGPDRSFVIAAYEYEVAGVKYNSDRITLENRNPSSLIFDTLNHAKIVLAYYNPKNPSEAVIINGLTNSSLQLFFFTIFWISFLLGIWLIKPNNKKALLIPFAVFIAGIIWSKTDIGIDANQLITVVEKYPDDHCKFYELSFKDHCHMHINNFRMEKKLPDFNRQSSIHSLDVLEKEKQADSILHSVIKVHYHHNEKKLSKSFKLKQQQFEKCRYKLLEINSLN